MDETLQNNLVSSLFEGNIELSDLPVVKSSHAVKSGVRVPKEKAIEVAKELTKVIRPYASRIRYGGSIRRRKEDVGDIDLSVDLLPNVTPSDLRKELQKIDPEMRGGDVQMYMEFMGLVVNIYILQDPKSMGALMATITGPSFRNVFYRKLAKSKGWKLSQYGLFDENDKLIANTERGIAKALNKE